MHNQMRAVPQTLDQLRCEIDRIDDALLELVEQRLAATRGLATIKDAGGDVLKLRPRREAEVVARLTARWQQVEPSLIRHLWSTLMAYGVQGQARMELVLCGERDRLALQDAVRVRFGPAASLRWVANEDEALRAARTSEAVAVIAPVMTADTAPKLEGLVVFETIRAGRAGEVVAQAIGRIAPEDAA